MSTYHFATISNATTIRPLVAINGQNEFNDPVSETGGAAHSGDDGRTWSQQEPVWRSRFKTPSQMQPGGLKFIIDRFLPPGVTFLGGPSGHGKTWVALSIAKALYRGEKFLGHFSVPHAVPIIYLVPEAGEATFRGRLDKLGLGNVKSGFYCQTLTDGPATKLEDPYLLSAVKDLKPVVFLDTAVRFNPSEDENSASENAKGMAKLVFGLLGAGAQAVIPLHHSPKATAINADNSNFIPTLENTLRGSGELGAMSDSVYCVLCSDKTNFRAEIHCVKVRDFDPLDSFEVQGRPYINNEGDLKIIRMPDSDPEDLKRQDIERIVAVCVAQPRISQRMLAKEVMLTRRRTRDLVIESGWKQDAKTKLWSKPI